MNFLNYDKEKKWEYEIGYFLTCDNSRIGKTISHYELYKKIVNLPGDILEFGVYKASSFLRWAAFRQILEAESSRKIIGFDAFGPFPRTDNPSDNKFIDSFEMAGGDGIGINELEYYLNIKKIGNYELIKGDITNTAIDFIEQHPTIEISMLHIDVDVEKPTSVILENFYERVVKGGLIVFDDYGVIDGETRAVDNFFANKKNIIIHKAPFSRTPKYIIKK